MPTCRSRAFICSPTMVRTAVLAAASGAAPPGLALPQTIGLDNDQFTAVLRSGHPEVLVGGTEARGTGLPLASSTPGQIVLGAHRATGGRPSVGHAGGRYQSAPAVRRCVSRFSHARRVPDRRRHRRRAGARRGTGARRGAGGTRSREDRVLQQREPRISHAAHVDDWSDGGRARVAGEDAARGRA